MFLSFWLMDDDEDWHVSCFEPCVICITLCGEMNKTGSKNIYDVRNEMKNIEKSQQLCSVSSQNKTKTERLTGPLLQTAVLCPQPVLHLYVVQHLYAQGKGTS